MKNVSPGQALLLMAPGIGFIAVFLGAALAMTLLQSVGYYNMTGPSGFSMRFWGQLFTPMVWDSFVYSVWIGIGSAVGSLLISYPLALYLRRRTGWNRFMGTLLRIPLFMPGLVAAFILINIIDYNGLVNGLLVHSGLIETPIRMLRNKAGLIVILVQVWKNAPYQLLIIAAVVQTVRSDIEEAAYNLGASRFQVFVHILLPLTVPGILIAVALVFIAAFGDYVMNSVAGPNYPVSLAILMVMKAGQQEWNLAACIGVLIMLVSILFVVLYTRIAKAIGEAGA